MHKEKQNIYEEQEASLIITTSISFLGSSTLWLH